jgi:uncharacterized protein (TIGR02596 family)
LVVPAFNHMGKASALTNAASLVADNLNFARQTALAKNRLVEVRFYQLPNSAGASPAFRALQLFIYDAAGENASPLENIRRFAPGVIALDDRTFSTLLSNVSNVRGATLPTTTLPGIQGTVPYQYFRYRPGGGTDLDPNGAPGPDRWFLTVKSENDEVDKNKPAKNYATLVLEPVTGSVRILRP